MLLDMPPAPPRTVDANALIQRAPERQATGRFGTFRLVAQAAGGTGTNDKGNSGPGRTGVPKDLPAPGASPGSGGTPDPNKAAPEDPKPKKKRAKHSKSDDAASGSGGTSGAR